MKIWYVIRRPIGYLLITLLAWFALAVIHGLPFLMTQLILGK
jgi:hypothetical protein